MKLLNKLPAAPSSILNLSEAVILTPFSQLESSPTIFFSQSIDTLFIQYPTNLVAIWFVFFSIFDLSREISALPSFRVYYNSFSIIVAIRSFFRKPEYKTGQWSIQKHRTFILASCIDLLFIPDLFDYLR